MKPCRSTTGKVRQGAKPRTRWPGTWYGVRRFFQWLESKSYKMHIRVLLSKYRSYTPCGTCGGARLKTESLLWRLGTQADADAVMASTLRSMPNSVGWSREQLEALPGLTVHDLMLLPIDRLRRFFDRLALPAGDDAQALKLLFEEISTRLKYLSEVGIGYLNAIGVNPGVDIGICDTGFQSNQG